MPSTPSRLPRLALAAFLLLALAVPQHLRAQSPWAYMPGAPDFSPRANGSPGGVATNGPAVLNASVPSVLWGYYYNSYMRLSGTTVFRTLDAGQTWQNASVTSSGSSAGYLFGNTLMDFSAVDAQTAWVLVRDVQAPNAVTLQRTTTGPTGFGTLAAALPADLSGIHFFDATTGIALARSGSGSLLSVYRSTDGGLTWAPVPATLALAGTGPYGARAALGRNVWVTGQNGDVFHSADGGLTWSTGTTGLGAALGRVVFRDAANGLAYESSSGQRVARTADGGRTWTVLSTPAPAQNLFIAAQPGGGTYIGATTVAVPNSTGGTTWTGLVVTSADDGASWQTRLADNLAYASVAMGPDGQLWASLMHNQAQAAPQHMLLRYVGTPLAGRDLRPAARHLAAYPNPSTGVIHLPLPTGALVRVYDCTGRQQDCPVAQETINLTAKPAGLYIITVTEPQGGGYSQRVVVEH